MFLLFQCSAIWYLRHWSIDNPFVTILLRNTNIKNNGPIFYLMIAVQESRRKANALTEIIKTILITNLSFHVSRL